MDRPLIVSSKHVEKFLKREKTWKFSGLPMLFSHSDYGQWLKKKGLENRALEYRMAITDVYE